MITARGETYRLERFPRVENSPYEFESAPDVFFFGRPASQFEKREYRIQQGVNGNSDSVFVYCTNIPDSVKPKDKIRYMGKEWTVASVGYYFESNLISNASVFSDGYIADRCPKGLNLQ